MVEKALKSLLVAIVWSAAMALSVCVLALCLGAMTHAIAWCVSAVAV